MLQVKCRAEMIAFNLANKTGFKDTAMLHTQQQFLHSLTQTFV